jgi:starch-binding outer membrane protein, SusD/RagB family
MKNKHIVWAVGFVGLFSTFAILSCDKTLDKDNPNAVTVDAYFKNSTELQKGTNSIYSVMHASSLVGREWFFLHDTRSDEFATGGSQLEAPRAQLLNGSHDPTNYVMNQVWNGLYVMIHRANTVIENGPGVTDNTSLRDRCVAEAKFLRAWAYFELVSQWGPVPVYKETVKSPEGYQPRSKEEDIYAFIIQDLTEAAAVLPGRSATDKGRATHAAANALLGRVLMQKGDYAAAKTALLKIPTSGADGYKLRDRYLDNFEAGAPAPTAPSPMDESLEFNDESIFEVSFKDKNNNDFNWGGNSVGDDPSANQTTVRNQEYNPVAWRNLIPSDKYLNNFENTATGAAKTDPRYSYSVYQAGDVYNNGQDVLQEVDVQGPTSTVNGVVKKVSWRKFMILYRESKSAAGFHPGGNNQRLIRYAEVLLMLAECENEANNIPGALGYLNQIRNRPSVAMPIYPTTQYLCTNKTQVTQAIMHEKMAELGGEELRNVDIVRWRKKGYFTTDPLSYFSANKHELLPIPQNEIDNNPKLGTGGIPKQNPGY